MTEINMNRDLALVEEAKKLFNKGDHLAIVNLLKTRVEESGLDPWIYALFGFSLFKVSGAQYRDIVMQSLEIAIKSKPDQAEFYYFSATVIRYTLNPMHSIEFYQTAIKLNPNILAIYMDLTFLYLFLGQAEDMIGTLRNAVANTKADKFTLLGMILQLCHYDQNTSMLEMLNYAKSFHQQYMERYLPNVFQYDLARFDINKPHLKIGVFSCNGLTDWAGVRALCMYLDKSRFSIYGYAKVPADNQLPAYCKDIKATYVSEIMDNCAKWNNYGDIALEDLAKIIHDDEIDIFIDLAGNAAYDQHKEPFTGLAVRKPAPVVATWLSSDGTTGATEVDYLLTSKYTVFPGDEQYYTEEICGIDNGLFQVQLDEVMELPEIQPPPCLSNSFITFGSLHRYLKFSSKVYETWSKILKSVPGSKLMLKYADLDTPLVANNVRSRFAKHGIAEDRIIIEGADSKFNFQNTYNKIDIALDPFPFSGGTTTIDALYMGVPVIANTSDRVSSRTASSMLMALGLEELVTNNEADYIRVALELAADKERIVKYNQTLRDRIKNGKMSAKNYAKDYGDALNYMWANSCKKRHNSEV